MFKLHEKLRLLTWLNKYYLYIKGMGALHLQAQGSFLMGHYSKQIPQGQGREKGVL